MLTVIALAVLAGGILLFRAGVKIVGALIGVVGFALLGLVILVAVAGDTYRIPSDNMRPALEVGDRIIALDVGGLGHGDVVVLHPPSGARAERQCGAPPPPGSMCARPSGRPLKVTFVDRVVGVGGDRLAMRNGLVIRDGERLREPLSRRCETAACQFPNEITVPHGHVFVLGDNRGESDDSRFWGPVPEDWVTGRVMYRYWPPDRFGEL